MIGRTEAEPRAIPMRHLRNILTIALLSACALQAGATEWARPDLRLRLVLPGEADWKPFQSSSPIAQLARARSDGTAMFVLNARILPRDTPDFEMTEEAARAFLKGVSGSQYQIAEVEPTTVDGVPAYRFTAELESPQRGKSHHEFLIWVHNRHICALTMVSFDRPVSRNSDLKDLVQSIRLIRN